jgi:DHA3 family macrolide efflux protein-like MFS transporter
VRILQPLRDGAVAALWGGLATAAIGDQLYAVALSWIAVAVFGTAAGYLGALQAIIVLATALLCGRWADRQEHRPVMIAADLARAAVLILVVAVWAMLGHPPAWGLILAVLVLAAGQAFFRPALQAILPELMQTPALLPATNALLDTTDRIARLLGPGLVAMLAASLPMMHFLSLDAAAFLLSASALVLIGRLRRLAPTLTHAQDEHILGSIVRGFRAMWQHRLLAYVLFNTGVTNGTWYAAMFLGLPLMINAYGIVGPGGTGLGTYGLVISCYGSTNLLATLVVGGRELPSRPARLMCSGNVIFGSGVFLLGGVMLVPLPVAARLPCLLMIAAFAAIGGPMSDITIATLRQTLLLRGDIAPAMRAYMVMNNVGLLIAMLIAPRALDAFGTAPVIAACGAIVAVVGVTGLLRLAQVIPQPAVQLS